MMTNTSGRKRQAVRRALRNPTAGLRPPIMASAGMMNYVLNGEPWFRWSDVPMMLRDPAVLFGMDVKVAPLSRVKVVKVAAPSEQMRRWITKTINAFWTRDLPLLINDYSAWGRMVGGVEWDWDVKFSRLELKCIDRVEPITAQPRVWRTGREKGMFAGYSLSQFTTNPSRFVSRPNAFWFAGRQRLGPYVDLPAIAGSFTPWMEKNANGGARSSRRLFFWRNAVGITLIYYPEGKSKRNGVMVNNEDAARELGELIANGASVAVPNTSTSKDGTEKAWQIEQRPSQADNTGIREYPQDLDGEIWYGMGVPPEVVRAMESGSGYDGRSIPNELHLGQTDTLAGMIFRVFREQVLDFGCRVNFGTDRYEVELTNLVKEFRQEHNAPKGPTPPGGGGDASGDGGGSGPGQPYTGPRGGHGIIGPDGKPRYGVDLSDAGGRYTKAMRPGGRERIIRRVAALAMLELREKALAAGEPDRYADEIDALADLADDPEELAKALGSVNLSWMPYGKSRTGKTRWKDDATGKLRYQESKPGTRTEQRERAKGSAKEAHRIAYAIGTGEATADDLRALPDHIRELPVERLRSARAMLGASFRNGRRRDEMVRALIDHVSGVDLEADKRQREEQDKPKPLTGAAAKNAKRGDGTPLNPSKEDVFTVHPASLHADPDRFQYKVSGIKSGGVTDELKGTSTYNPELGGTLLVWRDPVDGRDYVVNGHHRFELAQRTGAGKVNVRYIDAGSAKEARARGALANIAEGRGTATDAAKYLRDSGQDIDHLKRAGISMSGRVAADAAVLKNLGDESFDRLAKGELSEGQAVAVARHLNDPAAQKALFTKLADREEEGKDWSPREIETAAKKMARAGSVTQKGADLFGEFENEQSTFDQEVELEAAVGKALQQQVNDFTAVANTGRAERVKGAGNVLATEENKKRREQAVALAADFDRESGLKSSTSEAIRKAAAELATAKTRKERDGIKQRTLETVRGILGGQRSTQADAGGSGGGGTVAPGTPAGAPAGADRPDGGDDGRQVVHEEQGVKFVPHPAQRGDPDKYTTVTVDPAKLDRVLAEDSPHSRIPPGGGGEEIAGRRAGVEEFMKTGKPVEASHAVVDERGRVHLNDGRHRFSVLRDKGFAKVPLTVEKAEADKLASRVTNANEPPVELKAAPPADQSERLKRVNRVAREADLNDPMGGGKGVNIAGRGVPKPVAAAFDGHGVDTLANLTGLLNGGVDPSREFHSERLDAKLVAGGHSLLRDGGPFVVLGHPGKTIKEGGIGGVLVDGHHAAALDDLRAAFPHVKFVAAKDAAAALTKVAGENPPAVSYTGKAR